MANGIVKFADNEYAEWTTVMDAPATYIVNREEAVEAWGADRIALCDAQGTSSPFGDTLQDIIDGNRAGPKEQPLTLEAIREAYASPEAWEAFEMTAEKLHLPENRDHWGTDQEIWHAFYFGGDLSQWHTGDGEPLTRESLMAD